ncbi:hypothetical protein ACJIZ3_021625 [Penstemon smallii]|uniref:PUM-HD domain-containing protein n=1 Tax=Penstemon smallii TaxID=265156 RepID=A0ABD3SML4_9LAMI
MATESPIRILGETEKWPPRKQSNRYGPSSTKMAIEDLGLFLKGQSFQSRDIDFIPSRSESAPPSMEGSIAAIENIFSKRKSTLNPSLVYRSIRTIEPETEVQFPTNSLPAHEEESEDASSEHHSGSLDSIQEDSHHASSPSYDQNIPSSHESTNKTVNESDFKAAKVDVPDYHLTAEVSDVNSAHIESVKIASLSVPSSSDSHKVHNKEQIILQNNATPQESNTPRVQGPYSQTFYPGISHAYGNINQLHYGPPIAPPLYASAAASMTSPNPFYANLQPAGFFTPQYNMGGGYAFNSAVMPSYISGYSPQRAVPMAHAYDVQYAQKFYGGFPMQNYFTDPFHLQYIQPGVQESYGASGHFDHQSPRDNSKKGAELVTSPEDRKLKPTAGTNFPGGRYNTSHSHSFSGYSTKSYGVQNFMNSYSFLEEFKSGKGSKFELSDVAGHIAEFSVDQHGSRFIQQKLEICSDDEKALVFKEVVLHASKLMTDVFGNYVIQKLFEYGSPEQRKDLANQLEGQILPLSLQMYGCRVIQKALEVIDLEQKTRLIRELDGHVIRCVRDQNGNHVIQKCIESIPTDKIDFIISSFRGQVATLSMHPYGCRVIQRVLEHCHDELHTQFIVDEILDSVCSLAQDQYGNYVTQHVLERGKPCERSKIIEKLSTSIVQLSQHKFASNVVEKCLEYCDSTARDVLIKEIIGQGYTNDNLLIMMKDQYANYVIQKILQKCTIDQREMLLGLIRNHLTALKKYTYGKHIVSRFEQLYGEGLQTTGS